MIALCFPHARLAHGRVASAIFLTAAVMSNVDGAAAAEKPAAERAGAAISAGATPDAQTADAQMTFNNACRTCHSVDAGDNRLGPSLHAIIGREAGTVEGFAYSAALKGSSIVWDTATLDKFIANPEAVVPGNNMKPYTGISDAALRQEIIGFLEAGNANAEPVGTP